MSSEYKAEILASLERAETNLQVAKELLANGYYDVSASRSYYAAFYAASALLLSEEIDTTKHSGVIALIHQRFVKVGKLDKAHGRNLNWLFELRSVGDYGVSLHVDINDAIKARETAQDFFESAKALIET